MLGPGEVPRRRSCQNPPGTGRIGISLVGSEAVLTGRDSAHGFCPSVAEDGTREITLSLGTTSSKLHRGREWEWKPACSSLSGKDSVSSREPLIGYVYDTGLTGQVGQPVRSTCFATLHLIGSTSVLHKIVPQPRTSVWNTALVPLEGIH